MRLVIALMVLAGGCIPPRAAAAESCVVRGRAATMPLVELYTSEGCSSCPSADRWLSRRFASGEANFLAFHVDYWDAIGWPDRFASAAYSQRQRNRVASAGGRTVYTPQVMVGGSVNPNWRDDSKWRNALQQAQRPAPVALTLGLQETADGWRAALGAARNSEPLQGAQVWLAQHADGLATAVRAGENQGRTLRHDRVVRRLWGPWPLSGPSLSQAVELADQPGRWGTTAFVQDARGVVLQSLSLEAGGCDRGAP